MSVKNHPVTVLWLGHIVPVVIVLLMIVNVIRGEIYFPAEGNPLLLLLDVWTFTGLWHVSGGLLMKGALAGILIGEFKYRNHDATSNLGAIVIQAGLAGFFIGAVVFFIGFL
ncbi:MAG: hypothetical protein RIG82_05440 [Phycisphaeraceae bacterium]